MGTKAGHLAFNCFFDDFTFECQNVTPALNSEVFSMPCKEA